MNCAFVKAKFDFLVHDIRRVSAINEINSEWNYSRNIVDKVNLSHASNAFSNIQQELFFSQIVGVARIWDKTSTDRCSLIAVVDAARNVNFQKEFVKSELPSFHNRNIFPEVEARWNELESIYKEIQLPNLVEKRHRLRNFRDEYLAHRLLLSQTSQDEPVRSCVRYGDEVDLFNVAKDLTERLSRVITDGWVNFESHRQIHSLEAKAFSRAVSFQSRK